MLRVRAAARAEACVTRLVPGGIAAEFPLLALVFVAILERLVIVSGIDPLVHAHRAPPAADLTPAASRCLRRSEPHTSRCFPSRAPPPRVPSSPRTESHATDIAPCRRPDSHPPAIRRDADSGPRT